MTERYYPVSNHRLKRRAVAFMRELREAQAIVREDGQGYTDRVLAAIRLLGEHGVHPTDHLRVARARLWSWRVYRDPAS